MDPFRGRRSQECWFSRSRCMFSHFGSFAWPYAFDPKERRDSDCHFACQFRESGGTCFLGQRGDCSVFAQQSFGPGRMSTSRFRMGSHQQFLQVHRAQRSGCAKYSCGPFPGWRPVRSSIRLFSLATSRNLVGRGGWFGRRGDCRLSHRSGVRGVRCAFPVSCCKWGSGRGCPAERAHARFGSRVGSCPPASHSAGTFHRPLAARSQAWSRTTLVWNPACLIRTQFRGIDEVATVGRHSAGSFRSSSSASILNRCIQC